MISLKKIIIGIDEVGRGCLAGPVTVAAVAFPEGHIFSPPLSLRRQINGRRRRLQFRDSKALNADQRRALFDWLKNQPEFYYSLAHIPPEIIDQINIYQACCLGATNAYLSLMSFLKKEEINFTISRLLLDGGLKINNLPKSHYLSVIRGDQKYNVIKFASIVAKVNRDQILVELAERHPQYGLAKHKGYGTPEHLEALKRHGPCAIHRKSFLKNVLTFTPKL